MTRRDIERRARWNLERQAILHFDVEGPAEDDADVVVLAERSAGNRLHVLGPAPAGLEDRPTHVEIVEGEDLDPSVRERADFVRIREVLALEASHLVCSRLDQGVDQDRAPTTSGDCATSVAIEIEAEVMNCWDYKDDDLMLT